MCLGVLFFVHGEPQTRVIRCVLGVVRSMAREAS